MFVFDNLNSISYSSTIQRLFFLPRNLWEYLRYTEKKDLIDSIKWEHWIFFNWIN